MEPTDARTHARPPATAPTSKLGILVVLGFLLRIAAALVFNRLGLSRADTEHWYIARRIFEGEGFAFNWYGLLPEAQTSSFLPPLYAWIVAGILHLTGGAEGAAVLVAQALNAVLGAATIVGVAALATRIAHARSAAGPLTSWAGRAGWLAAATWALYPPAIGHAAQPQTQTLEAFLLVLLAWILVRAAGGPLGTPSSAVGPPREPSASAGPFGEPPAVARRAGEPAAAPVRLGAAALAGGVLGALLLVRPTVGIVWVFWGSYLLARALRTSAVAVPRERQNAEGRNDSGVAWSGRQCTVHRTAVFLAVAGAIAALVVLPWTLRNLSVHGRLVPVATNGGFNFYMGNNPHTGGSIPPLALFFHRMPEAERREWRSLTETERDRRFYRLGLEFWHESPRNAARGVARRFVEFALFRPMLFVGYPWWMAALQIASYAALFIPFLLALPRCRGPACAIPLLAVAGTLLVSLAFVVSMRFRSTVEPFLAAVAAAWIAERISGRSVRGPRDGRISARSARSRRG